MIIIIYFETLIFFLNFRNKKTTKIILTYIDIYVYTLKNNYKFIDK
jgi:hypothetical protein